MQNAKRMTAWATIGVGLWVTGYFQQPMAMAEDPTDRPVVHHDGTQQGYQRHRASSDAAAYGTRPGHGYWSHLPRYGRGRHRQESYDSAQRQTQSSGWYQRPYPYHLDYYKMRYNGSYEPYFGNIYGPPAFILPQTFVPGVGYGSGIGPGRIVGPQGLRQGAPY